jgi:hypothetical protein
MLKTIELGILQLLNISAERSFCTALSLICCLPAAFLWGSKSLSSEEVKNMWTFTVLRPLILHYVNQDLHFQYLFL